MKCDKCKSKADGYRIIEGGNAYKFCHVCSIFLDKIPTGNRVALFLRPDASQDESLPFSKVDRNILRAKERRSKGEKIW